MSNLWQKFVHKFFEYAPSYVVCLCFLPCGMVFGYTICCFVAESRLEANLGKLLDAAPLILAACCGLVTAAAMLLVKYLRGRLVFWQPLLLLIAGVFNVLGSCFYFAEGADHVGAFISYVAHSLTFVSGFSFLHAMCSRGSRALLLSGCCSCYLLGMATAVSLIAGSYNKHVLHFAGQQAETAQLLEGVYVDFAATYLCISAVMLALLIGLKVLNYLGTVDTINSLDNELRIANSNGSTFETRDQVIKRIQFFYVTKNQQWNVMLVLLFTEAVQFALFIYFIFWFAMNSAMRLTDVAHIDAMFWIIFAGSVLGTMCLCFVSVKVNFVATQLCLILLTVLAMFICTSLQTNVPFWMILLFFGMSYASLQIALIEVSHLRFTECAICASYLLKLASTGIVFYYFVGDAKNSYFYATDESTLMAQGFVFIIISALLALVVGMKVPRTYRTPLLDIQYGVYGIIFMKHQIEQLNVRWLTDGTIPTISNPADY